MTTPPGAAALVTSETLASDLRSTFPEKRIAIVDRLFPTLPDGVIEIQSAEVAYIFGRRALPSAHLDFAALRRTLEAEYGFRFPLPANLGALAPIVGERVYDADEIGRLTLANAEGKVTFVNGLLRFPDGQALQMHRLTISSDTINVNAAASTRAAEHFITELVPLMWALTGVKKTWDELKTAVAVVQYGTATKAQLLNAELAFLSEPLKALLRQWCAPNGHAGRMGPRFAVGDWEPVAGATGTYAIDDLNFMFHRSDPGGFKDHDTLLRISVTASSEIATGRMTITSELPLEEHLDLVSDLVRVSKQPR